MRRSPQRCQRSRPSLESQRETASDPVNTVVFAAPDCARMRLGDARAQPRATAVRGWGRQPRQYAVYQYEYSDWHTAPQECTDAKLARPTLQNDPAFLGLVCQSRYQVLVYPRTAVAAPVRGLPSTSLRAGRTTRGARRARPAARAVATGGVPRCVDAASLPRAACARLRRGAGHAALTRSMMMKMIAKYSASCSWLVGTVWILQGSTCCGELHDRADEVAVYGAIAVVAGLLLFLGESTARRLTVVALQLAVAVGVAVGGCSCGCRWRCSHRDKAVQCPGSSGMEWEQVPRVLPRNDWSPFQRL